VRRVARQSLGWAMGIALVASNPWAASADTTEIFSRFADALVKIRVVERGSGAKAVIGSGFRVTSDGLIATNYHVISKLVRHPDRYRAEHESESGEGLELEVLAVDAVHDLAIVRGAPGQTVLRPASAEPPKGTRLYAFGFPHDLGLSVVEGTHNGLLEHSVHPKIHFTGAINPGMSGGPAIQRTGEVVGINVSTAGNQVGFLVPAGRLKALLARVEAPGFEPGDDFLGEVRGQVFESQQTYLNDVLDGELQTAELGRFRVPSALLPTFHCWADAMRDEDEPFETATHQCSTQDYVYLSGSHWSGVIRFDHQLLTSEELNSFRFASLYTNRFSNSYAWLSGGKDDVTRFRCTTDAVDLEGRIYKTTVCARAYRKLAGLYDLVMKSAALGIEGEGLVSTLVLSGVAFEDGIRFTRRFLEAITWNR
jgi:serine protease Do